MDLALSSLDHDLLLENGTVSTVSGVDAIAQQIRIRLQFFKGEWFLDEREGVPYFQEILGQKPSERLLRALFTRVISGVPGVISVDKFQYTFDAASRTASISFSATLDDGTVLQSEDYGAFVLQGY